MVKKTLIFSLLILTAMVGPAVAFDIPELYTTTQVNPGLRGDVLLGYLYDVRDLDGVSQKTLINIVNTDPTYGMVARVRFREYKRSHECLDFHIPLSKGDVWSAEIFRGTNGAYIYSDDWTTRDLTLAYWELTHYLNVADGANPDAATGAHGGLGINFNPALADANRNRCLYGYFEIIGEERVSGDFCIAPACTTSRVARLDATWPCGTGFTWAGDAIQPCGMDAQNSLFGETWLVRVGDGTSQVYQDTALSNFSINRNGITGSVTTDFPNLRDQAQGEGLQPGYGGHAQVEFVLSKRNIFAQYWDAWTGFKARTSVVVTFPTKWFHFGGSPTFALLAAPDDDPFRGPFETIQETSPDAFLLVVRDREEHILTVPQSETLFSPYSSTSPRFPRWPFEVNIVGIYDVSRDADIYAIPPAQTLAPHSISDVSLGYAAGSIYRDNMVVYSYSSVNHFTSGWMIFDMSPEDGGTPATITGAPSPIPAGHGYQGETPANAGLTGFNFFSRIGPNVITSGYRGLPAIGAVLTEVIAAPYNYRTAIPWAYAVDYLTPDVTN